MTRRTTVLSCVLVVLCLILVSGWVLSRHPGIYARAAADVATSARAASRPNRNAVHVTVDRVKSEDVEIQVSSIGTVQAFNTVNIKTRVDGEITKILFQEGQDVKKDDALVVIDQRPYEAQLHAQEAMRKKDQAQLEGALLDLKRYQTLSRTKAIAEQQLDQQVALVEQLRAQVEIDEAQIDYAKTQFQYTTIRSPMNGRAGIRQVDQGNILHAQDNTTIVELTQLQPISVIFTDAAKEVARSHLVPGSAHVPALAFAADNTTLLDRGTIDVVDNKVDATTGTIKLKASFPNKDLRLWPGNFVNGHLTVDIYHEGLTLPSSAVRHGPNGDFVWFVLSNRTVEARQVEVIQTLEGRTLIARGLSRGDEVVTDGHFMLENGAPVETAANEVSIQHSRSEPPIDRY